MKPAQKKFLIFSLILILIVAGFIIYKNFFLEEKVKQYLMDEVNGQAEGKYELVIDELTIHLLSRSIYLNKIDFNTTESATQQLQAEIESISLSGFNIFRLIFSNELFISRVEINSPSIHIERAFTDGTSQDLSTLIERAHGEGNNIIQNVSLPETEINSLSLQISETDGEPYFSVETADFYFENIAFSENEDPDSSVPVEEAQFDIQNINYRTDEGLYNLQAAQAEFSSATGIFKIDQFQLLPAYDETEFFEQVGYRTDRIELSTREIELNGVDFDHALLNQQLLAENLSIQQADITIYRNKKFPQRDQRDQKPMPQQMIQSLPIPIHISDVSAQTSSIRYEELHEDAIERGAVYFNDLDVAMPNFTTIDTLMLQYGALSIDTATKFMGESDLRVRFMIPYNENLHNIEGTLAKTDPLILNPVFEPLAGVRIESGNVQSIRFEMQLSDIQAIGNAEVIYDDLRMALVDRETSEKNLVRRVGSFFINTFAIQSQNPPEDPRPGEVDYEREPEKSVFNYWWKSLQSGLMDSIDG